MNFLQRVAFNELINNKTLKQINDLIKKQQIKEIYKGVRNQLMSV